MLRASVALAVGSGQVIKGWDQSVFFNINSYDELTVQLRIRRGLLGMVSSSTFDLHIILTRNGGFSA